MRATPSRRPATAIALLALGLVASVGIAACSSDSGSDGAAKTTSTTASGSKSASSTGSAAGTPSKALADDPRIDAVKTATKIEGPITGGKYDVPYLGMPEGWDAKYGYTEEEYFLSGDAVSYSSPTAMGPDGMYTVEASAKAAPYKTRIVVRRPKDAKDFNGTVVVEWLNVTAGRDSDPDFGYLADTLLTDGYAYVSVSAQKTGVEPGGLGMDIPNVPEEALQPLKEWDPERYGSLSHPGDPYSYDIFGQAARTVIDTGRGTPLGDLDVERVIAVGESQSASRLVTYVDAVQPETHLFDGFIIQSRGSAGAGLNDEEGQMPPNGAQIREDVDVPVFQVETETDLDFLKFVEARQDDGDNLVTWETAGTAHADQSTLDYAVKAGRRWTDASVDLSTSCGATNNGPLEFIMQKALESLNAWIVDGDRPAASPRIETDDAGEIVRDADGLAKGGIRTPAVDAPTAELSGKNPSSSVICVLFGSTKPFTQAQLDAHYPDHDAYVAAVTKSADAAVADGFLLRQHADQMIADAKAADVP